MARGERTGNRQPRGKTRQRVPDLGYYYIVTDAKETERNYMDGLRDSLPVTVRDRIVITVRQTDIANMVTEAMNAAAMQPQYAEPWIVFDRDQVQNFDNIIKQAKSKGINVGWSNPCIEIWFHAYFGSMPVCDGSVKCVSILESEYKKQTKKKYKKNNTNIYAELCKFGDEQRAIAIAKAKLEEHSRDCKLKESEMNPVTGLHVLVDEIRGKVKNC